jgi:hypothetical protein
MKYRIVSMKHYGKIYFIPERSRWFGLKWQWIGRHCETYEEAVKEVDQVKTDAGQPLHVVWSD